MIRSMTGYGRCEITDKKGGCLVEVKSVNHRFLEIKTKFPQKFTEIEEIVKRKVKENFSRGYFEIYVTIDGINNIGKRLKLDKDLVRQYLAAVKEIKREFNISGKPELNSILQLNGILKFEESEQPSNGWVVRSLEKALERALCSLKKMRKREGDVLDKDITGRLNNINRLVTMLKGSQSKFINEFKFRFKERLDKVMKDVKISEDRLSQEIALIAERGDITEELIRLESHLKQFKQILKEGGAVGRKLEFILQEMNRESNTIGSKSIDYSVSQQVIAIKSDLEKIREQVQNIE